MWYHLTFVGLFLGSPYLYDRKAIFYREQNTHHIFKDGIEFIVRSHQIMTNFSMVTIGKMKMLVNASKNLSLMFIKVKEECDPRNKVVKFDAIYNHMFQDSQEVQYEKLLHESTHNPGLHPMVESKISPLVNVVYVKKGKYVF